MPYAIDEDRLNSPELKLLDISQPPVKAIPHQEFPKMVYLHPKDKAKEHKTKIVKDGEALETALAQGYRLKPHVPEVSAEPELASGEYETAEPEVKRGPGRPRSSEAA